MNRIGKRLGDEVKREVASQGVAASQIKVIVRAHLRYAGTDTPLEVVAGSIKKMQRDFEAAHKARFGFMDRDKEIVVEAVSVEAIGGGAKFSERSAKASRTKLPAPRRKTKFFSHEIARGRRLYARPIETRPHHQGAALLIEPNQTIVIEDGWAAKLTAKDHIVLTRIKALARKHAIGTKADPVLLEVFNNLFMSIAEQMGVTLQNTAYSVNIKERLDFSCAVFDASGSLVANAPHMPVHLGSMDRSSRP